MKKFLAKVPVWLSSNISIFFFLFLFVYLFIFGVIGMFNAWFAKNIAPNANVQLVLGNYTNVASALGAAIAAGASTAAHASLKKLHDKHDALTESVNSLHKKLDKIGGTNTENVNIKIDEPSEKASRK